MDAKCHGVAFTPRQGKPVEINALWYNPELDAGIAAHLAGTYGTLAEEVITMGLLEPLGDGAVEIEAQVRYARECEWALSAEDVLRRRTTLSVTGRDSDAVRSRVESLLAS